jgi:hypothetical protein
MPHITQTDMTRQVRKQSVMGYRNPKPANKIKPMKLSKAVEERLKKSIITPEMYERMLYFAKYQPAGKRRLNDTNLSKLVIGEDVAPLTDTQGLRAGGQVSEGNVNRAPLKRKPLRLTIKNKNTLKDNPNYPYFKNNFKA